MKGQGNLPTRTLGAGKPLSNRPSSVTYNEDTNSRRFGVIFWCFYVVVAIKRFNRVETSPICMVDENESRKTHENTRKSGKATVNNLNLFLRDVWCPKY